MYAGLWAEYLAESPSNAHKILSHARIPFTFFAYLSTTFAQLFSTSMIGYKAWCAVKHVMLDTSVMTATFRAHWREVREAMVLKDTRSTFAMLTILIESGVVYLALLVSHRLSGSHSY